MKTLIIGILTILGVYQLQQLRDTNLQAFTVLASILGLALIIELISIYRKATR